METPPPLELQRVAALVTGRRYLLLSVLATGVAFASTYQRLLLGPPASALALPSSNSSENEDARIALSAVAVDADAPLGAVTLSDFAAELMRSRVSAVVRTAVVLYCRWPDGNIVCVDGTGRVCGLQIVMHLHSVLMYHVFLAVAHASFGAIRPSEIQVRSLQ